MFCVMGTGSRSMVTRKDRVEIYEILQYKILNMFQAHPDLVLISGMAEGWDEAIAKIGKRNNIPYHCYIPTTSYGRYYWRDHSLLQKNRIAIFDSLVDGAAEVHYCARSVYVNGEHANFIRNRHMIAAADHALVYNPTSRGTSHCVRYLKAEHVPMEIYPFTDPVQEILF